MVAKGQMQCIVMKQSRCIAETLTNLVATFESADKTDAHSHYNASTWVEFHRLLIATLLAYGRALCALKEAKTRQARGSIVDLWCPTLRDSVFANALPAHADM